MPLAPGSTAAWPPAGWVTIDEAARMLGVSIHTFTSGTWRWRERLRSCGKYVLRPDGRRCNIYPVAEIERIRGDRAAVAAEREANRHVPFPPPGFVDRFGAAALLGIGSSTLNVWVRRGRLGYAGTLAIGPDGVECRIYAVAELERARAEVTASDAAQAKLPEGIVDRDGAATFLGVHPVTLTKWQRQGRLGRGTWMDRPNGKRQRVLAVAELERAREQMKAEAARPTAPEGFVELHEAARTLGVSAHTFYLWERRGRVTGGRVAPIPGTSARTKVYPVEEIRRLRDEIDTAAANFPPEGWLDLTAAARRAQVSIHVWKKWCVDGRVDTGPWVAKPKGGKCKLFSVEQVERLVEELGRDHSFYTEPDGQGGFRLSDGYVDRRGAGSGAP